MRRSPDVPFAPGIELRVVAGNSDRLDFARVNSGSEEVIQSFSANRALLDEIAGNQAGWAKVRNQLTNGPFLDIQKLYMGEGREAAE